MNILKPTEFHGYLELGGSTKPWKVTLLQEDGSEAAYVVKMFKQKTVDTQHAVAKEVYANVLAKEFCLPVPEICLVDFDKEFISNFLTQHDRTFLKSRHEGYKYACKLADTMSIVSPSLYKRFLKEYEIANVFAFDALIFNLDRGGFRDKPNLIVDDENFLLIDHELTFPFADIGIDAYNKVIKDFEDGKTYYRHTKHLLYPILKRMRTIDKKHQFDEFEEYLRRMNLNDLEQHMKILGRLGVSTGHYDLILGYLYKVKQDPKKFCDIQLASIV